MKKLILNLTALAFLTGGSSAYAAIGCLPGQCGGTPMPPKDDGGITPPRPSRPISPEYPYSVEVSGYFEVPSPECLDTDFEKAKLGAYDEAFKAATKALGTHDIKQKAPTTFITVKCAQSLYSSFKGNSWIVHIAVFYVR